MKIHGTAKGGALSKKDFGVAFGGGGGSLIDGTGLKAYYRFTESSTPFENLAGNVTDNDSIGTDADLDVNNGGDADHIEYAESTVAGNIPSVAKWVRTSVNDGAYADASTASDWNFLHYGASSGSVKWTVCFWLKITNTENNTMIVSTTQNDEGDKGLQIYLTNWNGAGVELGVIGRRGVSGTSYVQGILGVDYIVDDDDWYFYSLTFDETLGSANLKVKRDNSNLVTANKDDASASGNSSYPLAIQHNPVGETYILTPNNIAELSLWNRVLTDDEITSIYNSGSGAALYS